jgi:ADP-heptose:LPS heptosyltransferase
MKAPFANLIIRPEKIGDVVISTPVIRAFKETYPDQPLHLLTDPLCAEIVRHDPHLDKIIAVEWKDRYRGQHAPWWEIYGKLKPYSYERAAILYANCSGWNWLCAMLGIRHVAQIGGTMASIIFNHKKMLRRTLKNPWHMIDAYIKVAECLGAKTDNHIPQLYLSKDETISFTKKYPAYGTAPQKILMHLAASPAGSNYSISAFQELSLYLASYINCPIFVTGSVSDAAEWRNPGPHIIRDDLLGRLSIREMLCAVYLSDLLICNSTGVIHIGAALNRRVLGLYSSDPNNDEIKWGPLIRKSRILKPAMTIYDLKGNHDLSHYISKEAITNAALELLSMTSDERDQRWPD